MNRILAKSSTSPIFDIPFQQSPSNRWRPLKLPNNNGRTFKNVYTSFVGLLMIELSTAVTNRQKLESQLQENTSVQNVRTVHAKANRRSSRNCLRMRKYINHTDRYYLSSRWLKQMIWWANV